MGLIVSLLGGLSLKKIGMIAAVLAFCGALLYAYGTGYENAKYKIENAQLRQAQIAYNADIARRDALNIDEQKKTAEAEAKAVLFEEKSNELIKQLDEQVALPPDVPTQPGLPAPVSGAYPSVQAEPHVFPKAARPACLNGNITRGLRKLW